jgi:hypothetical protein
MTPTVIQSGSDRFLHEGSRVEDIAVQQRQVSPTGFARQFYELYAIAAAAAQEEK